MKATTNAPIAFVLRFATDNPYPPIRKRILSLHFTRLNKHPCNPSAKSITHKRRNNKPQNNLNNSPFHQQDQLKNNDKGPGKPLFLSGTLAIQYPYTMRLTTLQQQEPKEPPTA